MNPEIRKRLFGTEGTVQYRKMLEVGFEAYVRDVVLSVLKAPVEIEIRLADGAVMPTQPYSTDACWDLYTQKPTEIPPHSTVLVPTGVYISIPEGYEGTLRLRSGCGKKGLSVHIAVFDSGYQGELSSFVHNRTAEAFFSERGDRVIQFCLRRVIPVVWKSVKEFTPSGRGTKGHGSSGR